MTDALHATFILPFDHDLPEGMEAGTIVEVNDAGVMNTGEVTTSLKANTPYVIFGTQESVGTYEFTGIPTNTKDKYSKGLMVGTYKYLSAANGDFRCDGTELVLQVDDNGKVAWHQIADPTLDVSCGAYHCYVDTTLG